MTQPDQALPRRKKPSVLRKLVRGTVVLLFTGTVFFVIGWSWGTEEEHLTYRGWMSSQTVVETITIPRSHSLVRLEVTEGQRIREGQRIAVIQHRPDTKQDVNVAAEIAEIDGILACLTGQRSAGIPGTDVRSHEICEALAPPNQIDDPSSELQVLRWRRLVLASRLLDEYQAQIGQSPSELAAGLSLYQDSLKARSTSLEGGLRAKRAGANINPDLLRQQRENLAAVLNKVRSQLVSRSQQAQTPPTMIDLVAPRSGRIVHLREGVSGVEARQPITLAQILPETVSPPTVVFEIPIAQSQTISVGSEVLVTTIGLPSKSQEFVGLVTNHRLTYSPGTDARRIALTVLLDDTVAAAIEQDPASALILDPGSMTPVEIKPRHRPLGLVGLKARIRTLVRL